MFLGTYNIENNKARFISFIGVNMQQSYVDVTPFISNRSLISFNGGASVLVREVILPHIIVTVLGVWQTITSRHSPLFCTIALVNPNPAKMATKFENTRTIAISPKSLVVSNLAKIAEISIDISIWASFDVAVQPMLRTVLDSRVMLIRERTRYDPLFMLR